MEHTKAVRPATEKTIGESHQTLCSSEITNILHLRKPTCVESHTDPVVCRDKADEYFICKYYGVTCFHECYTMTKPVN